MQAFSAADEADAVLEQGQYGFKFYGNGPEYFKIWIVNLALSVLTLGIFSAWAKVRAQRYFHANTELDGSRFEYHGQAKSILLGRGIAALLLIGFVALSAVGSALVLVLLMVGIGIMPWLISGSMRFRTRMVSWRGVRFSWRGTTGRVYGQWFISVFFTLITFGIYYFAANHRMKRLFIDKLQFGNQQFSTTSSSGDFFLPYFWSGLCLSLITLLFSTVQKATGNPDDPSAISLLISLCNGAALYVIFKTLGGALNQRMQSKTRLAHLRFSNTTKWVDLVKMYGGFALLMLVTLGLYWPWARIKDIQYRLAHLQILGSLPLLKTAAVSGDDVAALGQEAAALFDFDVSF